VASAKGFLELVRLLLSKGAAKDARDNAGRTPLHWACYNGRAEVAAALLDKGADKHAKSAFVRRCVCLHLRPFRRSTARR
jgi:ankyrin repeat protein